MRQVIASAQSVVASVTDQVASQVASINGTTLGNINKYEAQYLPIVRKYDH